MLNIHVQKEGAFELVQFKEIFEIVQEKYKKENWHINLILTNDKEIRKLNQTYRQKDKPTDVLSFEYEDVNFLILDEENISGEIVISVETAILQAEQYNISVQTELNKLFIHGLLHLLGYDHKKNKAFFIMKKEEEIIEKTFMRKDKW